MQGIKVQMLEDYDVDSTGGIELRPMYSEEDVLTDESGYFHIRNEGFPKETLSIGFSDIDGEENGGELVRRQGQGRYGYYVSVDFQWVCILLL